MKIFSGRLLFLIMIVIYLMALFIYAFIDYQYYKNKLIGDIDRHLYNYASSLKYILPEDYHDRAKSKDAISLEEDKKIANKLTKFVKDLGFKYSYTVIKKDDKLYFAACDLVVDPETERGTFYYYHYDDADESYYAAFKKKSPTYKNVSDKWGTFRTVMIPEVSPGGVTYLACADYDITFVEKNLQTNLIRSLLIIIIFLFLAVPFVFLYVQLQRRHLKDVEDREKQLRTLSNNLPDGYVYRVIIDPDSNERRFIYLSDGVEELHGVAVEDILKDATLLYGQINEESVSQLIELENRAFENMGKFYAEVPFNLPGRSGWLLLSSSPHQLDDNTINWDGIAIDISKQKNAEEALKKALKDKEVLIRELYHRTTNTLQSIKSMLKLQANVYKNNNDFQNLVNVMDRRIMAIAMVHDKLYQSKNLSNISIKEYINDLVNLIGENFKLNNIMIELYVEEHLFLIDTLIPLGLIVNELLTNSLQHAFAENQKGIISIKIHTLGDKKHLLEYSDNGIGVPDDFNFKNQKSLGLKLIHIIAESQMDGEVSMKNNNGVTCSIEFYSNLYENRVQI